MNSLLKINEIEYYKTLINNRFSIFMKMNQKELLLMSQESVSLSEIITPKIWVKKLTSLL